jgi:hypothetical protein
MVNEAERWKARPGGTGAGSRSGDPAGTIEFGIPRGEIGL